MRRAHIEVFLGLVIGVVAAGYGPDLDTGEQASHVGGGGYLIRNASLVLTMDPNLGAGGGYSDGSRTPTSSSKATTLRPSGTWDSRCQGCG